MNKTLIRYLENRFVEIARESGRYQILTKNNNERILNCFYRRMNYQHFLNNFYKNSGSIIEFKEKLNLILLPFDFIIEPEYESGRVLVKSEFIEYFN